MSEDEVAALEDLLRRGAGDASVALSKWLGRPATIAIKRLDRLPLEAAADALGSSATPICAAAMTISGSVDGVLLLACDDASGLALCDMLLERPAGSATTWDEVERSSVLETANIIGCSYLGGIAAAARGGAAGLVPSPPLFVRDFAAAVMGGLLLERAAPRDAVFVARTEFAVGGTPIRCSLVFVPDAESLHDIEAGLDAGRSSP
jgi:chemotaxis protein CheC